MHSMRMLGTDRRRQLIETALDVFSRKGFDGATTKFDNFVRGDHLPDARF